MKTYWKSGGTASRILDLGTRRRLVVIFTTRGLYHRGRNLVGRRAGLDAVAKTKSRCSYRESNSDRSVRSLVTIWIEIPRLEKS